MESNKDVIIVGGGIIGLACAHYLLEKNASVRIVEQDTVGSGASHGNCGLIHLIGIIPLCAPGVVRHEVFRAVTGTSPLYIKPTLDITFIKWLLKFAAHCSKPHMDAAAKAKNELLNYSRDLFSSLLSEPAMDCDFEKKGLLLLFKDKKYLEKYSGTNAFLESYGYGAKRLDTTDVLAMEPAVSKDIAGAWYNEYDWHLRPEMLVASWKKALVKKGLIVEEKCRVTGFGIEKGKVNHVNTIKGQYKADHFILTTGAWAAQLNRQLNLTIPVQPGKGYSITMERPDPSPEIPCLLYERNMVATPWKSGFRLGGTMEFSGFSSTLNEKRLEKLVTGAKEYLNTGTGRPALEHWTGLRPMTHDDLPIIDRSPAQDNLYIATGHGMLGITLATGTGKAVCDMIHQEKPGIDMAPYSMERF